MSVTLGVNDTSPPHWPASAEMLMGAGHVSNGRVVSAMLTVNEQFSVNPDESVTVYDGLYTPTGQSELLPNGDASTTDVVKQLSHTAAGRRSTCAPH